MPRERMCNPKVAHRFGARIKPRTPTSSPELHVEPLEVVEAGVDGHHCPAGCAEMTRPTNSCTVTDNPTEDMAAEAAVSMAAAQGIKTFVIGIGAVPTAQNTLNQLAIAGGEAQAGAATSYYPAGDEAALEVTLTDIVNKVAACPH
jgi:hypothetical protein